MRTPQLIGRSVLVLFGALVNDAQGACQFNPTAGDDAFVCDNGSASGLTDLRGNNTLSLPVGGTGAVTGGVTFGPGADRVEIASGQIGGAVSQGSGIDDFLMSAGQIQSLAQGDGLDTFTMTGGTILGAFEDGDIASFSNGSIGRVDMKLDDNLFDMSGGQILGNLVTGFGTDTVLLSGGRIGGNISVSGGDDHVAISGGSVGGQVLMSFGNDTFIWTGGTVGQGVQLAAGDDTASLIGLADTQLGTLPFLDGGAGADRLTLQGVVSTGAARYLNWETVAITQGSVMTLDDTWVLGDSQSGSGHLAIDSTSTISSNSGQVSAFNPRLGATLSNAGLIDLTRSGARADDRFTVIGSYSGDSGHLALQSVLEGDGAASDRLVVSQGQITGTTLLNVTNLGGGGALTTADGIQLVEANEGASSTDNAFQLGGSLSVGEYQYYLFKGGLSAGSENSWYLRSSVAAPVVVAQVPDPAVDPSAPQPPEAPEAPAAPAAPTSPTPAAAAPVAAIGTPALPQALPGEIIALYRIEVPVYSVVPPAAALMAQTLLGTFHQRQGEQSLLRERGAVPAGWARAFGNQTRQHWDGDVAPSFDGDINGYQIGHDLYAGPVQGAQHHVGVFVGEARMRGDVKGFALGFEDNKAGDLALDGASLGAYWTYVQDNDSYLDGVLMATRYDGHSRSVRGMTLDLDGHAYSASLEGGYPIPLVGPWFIEPQAQFIAQKIDLDSANDPVSRISFDTQPDYIGRLGARIKGELHVGDTSVVPYLRANLWHRFGGKDSVRFDGGDPLKTEHAGTYAELALGGALPLSEQISFYGDASYGRNLDSVHLESVQGTVGLRVSW